MIRLKRAYAPPEPGDGPRFLVDQLWPHGLKKEQLHLAGWLKEVAPSTKLRQWFGHDPKKWPEFQRRYFEELKAKPETWQPLLSNTRDGNLTLVFAAKDPDHNNAVALRNFLNQRLKT
jgi:uncharacterized protein YeaO (DUF488 family)